jgi:hypothetical protein
MPGAGVRGVRWIAVALHRSAMKETGTFIVAENQDRQTDTQYA